MNNNINEINNNNDNLINNFINLNINDINEDNINNILLNENLEHKLNDNYILWDNQIKDINVLLKEILLIKNSRIKYTSPPSSGKTISILYLIKLIKNIINRFSVLLITPNNLFNYWIEESKKINLKNVLVFKKVYNNSYLVENNIEYFVESPWTYLAENYIIKNKKYLLNKEYLNNNKEDLKNKIFIVSSLDYDDYIKLILKNYNFTFDLVIVDECSTIQSRDISSTFPISIQNIILIDSAEKKENLTRKLNFIAQYSKLSCVEVKTIKIFNDDFLIPIIINIKVRPKSVLKLVNDDIDLVNFINSEENILNNKNLKNYNFENMKEKMIIVLLSNHINILINMISTLIKFYHNYIKLTFNNNLINNSLLINVRFNSIDELYEIINDHKIDEFKLNKLNIDKFFNINRNKLLSSLNKDNYNEEVNNYNKYINNIDKFLKNFKINEHFINEDNLNELLSINYIKNIKNLLNPNLNKLLDLIFNNSIENIINNIMINETNKNIINNKNDLISFYSKFLLLINNLNDKIEDIYNYDFENTCYLCLEEDVDLVIEPCKHLFHNSCFEIVNNNLENNRLKKCYCNNLIERKIKLNRDEINEEKLQPAFEKAFDLIKENIKNKKIVVFVDDFNELLLENLLNKEKINFKNIKFNKSAANTVLKDFNDKNPNKKDKELNLLILNKHKAAEGLNLQVADIMIMVSIPSTKELTTQIHGRCLRFGRKSKLTIYNLIK